MSIKHNNKRVEICLTIGTIGIVVAGLWVVLATPAALAKKPPTADPWVLADAEFVVHEGFGTEIVGYASEVAEWTYRTVFGTGNVTVTLATGDVLDQKPFLIRLTDDATGERYLAFRIGLQGGHQVKDRCSTPNPNDGTGDVIPFPVADRVWHRGDPNPPSPPSLEVVRGGVDENLDMLRGAHVILHLHVSNIPLVRIAGPEAGKEIGRISIGDIEFTLPQ